MEFLEPGHQLPIHQRPEVVSCLRELASIEGNVNPGVFAEVLDDVWDLYCLAICKFLEIKEWIIWLFVVEMGPE